MQPSHDINSVLLGAFSLLLVIPFVINRFYKRELGQEMVIAVVRMAVQLLLVGVYLEFVSMSITYG